MTASLHWPLWSSSGVCDLGRRGCRGSSCGPRFRGSSLVAVEVSFARFFCFHPVKLPIEEFESLRLHTIHYLWAKLRGLTWNLRFRRQTTETNIRDIRSWSYCATVGQCRRQWSNASIAFSGSFQNTCLDISTSVICRPAEVTYEVMCIFYGRKLYGLVLVRLCQFLNIPSRTNGYARGRIAVKYPNPQVWPECSGRRIE